VIVILLQAILCGLGLIALAIASVPYSSTVIKPAYASNGVHKIAICEPDGSLCARIHSKSRRLQTN